MDLFSSIAVLERLKIPEAEVYQLPHVDFSEQDNVILRRLMAETDWRQESVTVWGKKHPQPRLIAWYGDAGYSYSGIRLPPLPWTSLLTSIRRKVESIVGVTFNSVLLNLYRDHNDSMGFHSDDERELGRTPTIASVSFGEERTFVFRSKVPKKYPHIRVKLRSGHLLVMKGETQINWQHAIDKESVVCGPRVNLTFRQIFPVASKSKAKTQSSIL